jgi:acetyltransferase-like isoleucine patch superfamily enzyme
MADTRDSTLTPEIMKDDDPGIEKTELQAALTDEKKSALNKYQEVVVGSSSLLTLLRFELLTSLLGPLPGALGLVSRKKLFPSLFGGVGRNVVFGKSITIRHGHKIFLGDNVVIDDYAVLDAKGSGNDGIVIGDNVMIGRNSVISCKNGDIDIGDNTNIAMNCFIQSAKHVKIGRNVLFAAYCYVIGGGDHSTDRIDVPIIAQRQVVKGITIEDNCWLGAGVKVQDGVAIGRDSILGSGAVVTRDVPEFSVAVGVPAKVVGNRDSSASDA